MPALSIILLATGDFAVPILHLLAGGQHRLLAVVTQPDRPAGRGRHLTLPPVKRAWQELPEPRPLLFQPQRIRAPETVEQLRSLQPGLLVAAAFGQLLTAEVLSIPRLGCVNVHGSLLPKYRGAAPVQWAVINGERETGVTVMWMDEGLDTGDIIMQRAHLIAPDATAGSLMGELAEVGAILLEEALEAIARGTAPRVPQDHSQATLAPRLRKEDARLDWSRPAARLVNQIRGMNPWPGAFTEHQGRVLKIRQASAVGLPQAGAPGEIAEVRPSEGLLVIAGEGGVLLRRVQPENRPAMSADEYVRGHPVQVGELLGHASEDG